MEPEPDVEVLAGGLGNEGRVVRVGDTVRRPVGPWTPAVHRLLGHLERAGFEGAPRVLGVEGDTELLSFVPGEVAVPPFPAWSANDALPISVARLQRSYHEAVADFRPPLDAVWGDGPASPEFAGTLVCHNDLCLENVVVVDGRAAAFIDFDFARPVDRLWDIAIALRHWAPMWDPRDLGEHRGHLDSVARCGTILDVHGLTRDERERTIDALLAFSDRALDFVRTQAEAGHTGHFAQWNAGYEGKNRRSHRWITDHRDALVRAGVRIEAFLPADQAAVRALILDGLREHWGEVDPALNPDLDDIAASYGHGTVLVARSGHDIVGTGTLLPGATASVREVVRMSVATEFRGRGVGTRILSGLVRIAREQGARRIELETTAAWTDVVAFYTAFGFTVTHQSEGSFGLDTYFALDLAD
jgi:GNAT superfamily N-acetyltransferase